jgi:hypothetical protein
MECGGRSHRLCVFTRDTNIQKRQLRLPHSRIINASRGYRITRRAARMSSSSGRS